MYFLPPFFEIFGFVPIDGWETEWRKGEWALGIHISYPDDASLEISPPILPHSGLGALIPSARDSCSSSRRGSATQSIDFPACCCNTHRSLCCACHSSSSRPRAFRPLSPPWNRRALLLRGGVCLESPSTASPGCLQALPAWGLLGVTGRTHQSRDLGKGLPILPQRKQHSRHGLGCGDGVRVLDDI